MSLLTSKVPRTLEIKARLFGFELGDLLFIFLYLALSNLIFGTTRLKFPMVWIGTALLGVSLYFIKRGKPDHYLQHLAEYHRLPSVLTAGCADTEYQPFLGDSLPNSKSLNVSNI